MEEGTGADGGLPSPVSLRESDRGFKAEQLTGMGPDSDVSVAAGYP